MEVIQHTYYARATQALAKLTPVATTLILAGLFFPTISHLYGRWIKWDESQSHGLIVIAVFLYFLYQSAPWQVDKPKPAQLTGTLILLALTSCCWFAFHLINLYILEQLLLLPLLFLMLASIYGWSTCFKHLILLALPIFAIPIWDQLTDLLVNLSGFTVGKMVTLADMQARIDGNSIFIPSGHIVIADGCSGLRYLIIALALGYIISYLNHYSIARVFAVLGIACLLGLMANWLRIFILVVVGYETNMQSSLMSDHEMFGWLLFAGISFPAIYFAPVVRTSITPQPTLVSKPQLSWLLPVVVAAVGPLLTLMVDVQPATRELKDRLSFELQPITAKKMPLQITNPKPEHTENARTDDNIYIQVDQYQRRESADKLVPYMTRLYDNEIWSPILQKTIKIQNRTAELSLLRHKTKATQVAQLQWFELSNLSTHKIALAKLLQIPALLKGDNHFMIITLQAKCTADNCDAAITQLQNTANSLNLHTQGH